MFGRVLFITFLAVPLIEIALFVTIGQWIGLVPTLLGVVVTAIIGSMLIRWQGLSVLARMRETLDRGQLPARQVGDAMLIGVGGLLLLLPGYFTDLIGLILIVPFTRELIWKQLARHVRVVTPGGPPRPPEPGVIELDDGTWRER